MENFVLDVFVTGKINRQLSHKGSFMSFPRMIQGNFMGVSRKFQVILRRSQGYFKSLKGVSGKFQWCFNAISRVFQGSFKSVSMFQESFKGVPRKMLGYFKEISRVFQESLKGDSRTIEGYSMKF